MAIETLSTITGSIQKYFEKDFMDRPQTDFRTPLANSNLLEQATIPPNSGQYAEFRVFTHFTIEGESGNDSPKTYGENGEPSTNVSLTATIFRVGFEMLADYFWLGNVQMASDPIDLMRKNKEEMYTLIRRKIHRLTNDRFVRPIDSTILNAGVGTAIGSTNLPAPFKTIYAGGVPAFAGLTADSVFTADDFKRARMALRNEHVPGVTGTGATSKYAAIVDEAILAQLQEDESFKDAVKRHEDMLQKAVVDGAYIDWEGMRFTVQDDEYRCHLPSASGVLTTRKNAGKVHVAHILGRNAAGYVDFGKSGSVTRRTLKPTFKVQDTSVTGIGPTVGWRMAYQACVMDNTRGLNLAGTTRYDETVTNL